MISIPATNSDWWKFLTTPVQFCFPWCQFPTVNHSLIIKWNIPDISHSHVLNCILFWITPCSILPRMWMVFLFNISALCLLPPYWSLGGPLDNHIHCSSTMGLVFIQSLLSLIMTPTCKNSNANALLLTGTKHKRMRTRTNFMTYRKKNSHIYMVWYFPVSAIW